MGLPETETTLNPAAIELRQKLERMRAAVLREPFPDRQRRDRWMQALDTLLVENIDPIAAAISADFGNRSAHETRLLEIFTSVEEISHARKHLKKWMKPQRRGVSLWFQPGSARIVPQPLGVVGIIVAWNYPVYLAISPLVSALAAGNRVMVKMSEYAPKTGELFAKLIAKHFTEDEVCVVLGDPAVGEAFSSLPFDHLLFTGSTSIGRSVMRAAAENLTPVTLELGGKSPAIVGPDYPIDTAAQRIGFGKCVNAGQTCVAPDYVMVPAGKEREFVEALKKKVTDWYPDVGTTPDFTSIINERHFGRLNAYLDDARAKGAEIIPLGSTAAANAQSRRIPPTALLNVNGSMQVMQQEIFGPLLPVISYKNLDEAIAYVNLGARPLALYYFDYDKSNVDRILTQTISGGVTVNDTVLHVAQSDMPFGGIGPSGMGHYHGREGFDTFSKMKAVFYQSRINGFFLFMPPYGKFFDAVFKVLLKLR